METHNDGGGNYIYLDMTNNVAVKGFQVQISNIEIIGASGGRAGSAGFVFEWSNSGDMVAGRIDSFNDAGIPAGDGHLVKLYYEGELYDTICIESGQRYWAGSSWQDVDESLVFPMCASCNNCDLGFGNDDGVWRDVTPAELSAMGGLKCTKYCEDYHSETCCDELEGCVGDDFPECAIIGYDYSTGSPINGGAYIEQGDNVLEIHCGSWYHISLIPDWENIHCCCD
jgi:hypothetical protein